LSDITDPSKKDKYLLILWTLNMLRFHDFAKKEWWQNQLCCACLLNLRNQAGVISRVGDFVE
jgi:hypothetical protein